MTLEIPVPVRVVTGATVVDFPWGQASAVVAALGEATASLSSSLASRASMWPSISEWEGSYRQEFDEVHLHLTAAAIDLVERGRGRARSVVDRADDANREQSSANDEAEERSAALRWWPR